MRRIALLLAIVLVLAACGSGDDNNATARSVPDKRVPGLASGFFYDLAWLPGGWLVLSHEPDPDQPTWQVWRVPVDGGELEPIALADDASCRRTEYLRPARLPDGRLGVVKSCRQDPAADLISANSYLAVDLNTDAVESLAPLSPADGRQSFVGVAEQDASPTTVSWDPSMKRALVNAGGSCSTIATLTAKGVSPISAQIVDGKRSWSLSTRLNTPRSESCAQIGDASLPAWSPEGAPVAFFASPQRIGHDGPERFDQPANLYVMDPDDWKPRKVLADVRYPSSLEWSPDGRWLVFAGGVDGDTHGVWLFDPATEERRRVSDEEVSDVTWSPDGRRLAGIVTPSGDVERAEVRVFDVAELVR